MCSSYVTTQILDFWLVWAPETCQTIHVTSLLTVQHTYTQDQKGYIYFHHLSLQYLHMTFILNISS
jgi:hypothetical protein